MTARYKFKMKFATERVIKEVEVRPVIWDMSNKMYRDQAERQKAWQEICQVIFEDYDQLCYDDQNLAVRKVQERWRTARDSYTKIKNSRHEGCTTRKKPIQVYAYYDMLSFLDVNYKRKNSKFTSRFRDESGIDDDNSSVSEISNLGRQKRLKKKRKHYEEDQPIKDECESDLSNTDQENLDKDPLYPAIPEEVLPESTVTKQKSSSFENNNSTDRNIEINTPYFSMSDMSNDDIAFFVSLMPTLQNFTSYQKLLFRSKILQFLLEFNKEQEVDKNQSNQENLPLQIEQRSCANASSNSIDSSR